VKRIISFDGGGIRGIFSLRLAARIEALFRQHYGKPDLVLADVVDFFAGTSTGAIIASFLSWGAPVSEVEHLYASHCKKMFAPQPWWQRYKSKYRGEVVTQLFREHFREDDHTPALLGSKKLKTLLLIVMRNASTGSPWPICNHPGLKFNDPALADCNLRLPLWQLLRASTAAPSIFPPEEIALGDQKFIFIDGGITPFLNPSLLAILMATMPQYGIRWPSGRDQIHLLSVGTGEHRAKLAKTVPESIYIWDQLRFVIPALMGAESVNQDLLCRVLGHCLYGGPIDAELGEMLEPSLFAPAEQKFSYVRYNCRLDTFPDPPWSAQEFSLDNLAMIPRLHALGTRYAEEHIRSEHLML